MLRIPIFLLICGLTYCIGIQKPLYQTEFSEYYFNDFVRTYNKLYPSKRERNLRFQIFKENLKRINHMNGADTARYGINQFADMSSEEFVSTHTGYKAPKGFMSSCTQGTPILFRQAPDSFDWRDKNVVSPVKDQGRCGSCYSFSSTGNIESQYAIHHNGVILDLSEQQLVDCSQVNSKCEGGLMAQCMMDIMDQGGIESNTDYPYTAAPGSCSFDRSKAKVKLTGCIQYHMHDENMVKETLYRNGPLAIALAAEAVQAYQGGIINDCPGDINHAVLLVGYGSENGQDYWIIKNSWGATWGESGYFRISRGHNTCQFINSDMTTAIVA